MKHGFLQTCTELLIIQYIYSPKLAQQKDNTFLANLDKNHSHQTRKPYIFHLIHFLLISKKILSLLDTIRKYIFTLQSTWTFLLHFLALKWLVRTLKDVINIVFQLVNSFLEKKVEERIQTAHSVLTQLHMKKHT